MKSVLLEFATVLLSKDQMRSVKGGYGPDGGSTCEVTQCKSKTDRPKVTCTGGCYTMGDCAYCSDTSGTKSCCTIA